MFWPVRLMLPASAFASALLDWWTLPSSPGLRTRIPTAVLLGLSCRAMAPASAAWPLELSWPATWVPEPLCDWSMFWPVRLPLPASAFASALLDWWTLPSSPGLKTRIPTAVLLGLSCAATAMAPASCQFSFDWPATWVPDWQPHCVATGAATGAAVPPWAWSMFWPVRLMLPASAFASALLDWWTLPSSPGLRTRIPTAVLLGLSCRAMAPASAAWPLELSWPATWVPEPLCDWSMFWPVRVPLPASAFASALLDWWTLPSSPGLKTRIPTAVLLGLSCAATAMAPASCQFSFDWPATWVPDWQPHCVASGAATGAAVPPWAWSMFWPVRLMLPASAFASALLDWWTLPSSPGLRTRIPTAVLLGLSCRAMAPASAAWPLEVSWPATWVPEPLCDWSMFWPVRLMLPASAFASALLDWWTLPSSPGLRTRIPTAVLLGLSCAATAMAPASCQFSFDWPATWVPDWQPHCVATGAATGAAVPPWAWSMFWPVRLMLPASAFASALLDWWTLPSSPGLRTRIPTAVLLGLSCRAMAPASAAWPLEVSWPATWVPEPLCDWSMFWPVRLMLPASAFASALLDWWTLPSSPGLRTRIPTAVLLGLSCAATAMAPASCQFSFDWPATWVPDWQPHCVATGAATGAAVPPWAWSMFWPVRLMLPASAFASALLDWWTLPSSPGLRTRIPTAVLLGLSCRAMAPASAAWPLELSWPATWVPEPLCDWSMFWPVRLPLPASAVASALLDWWTLPSSPGLKTRIPTAVLLGLSCAATARAPASCQLLFDWPATWVPDWQPHGVATGAVTGAAVPPWDWSMFWPVRLMLPASAVASALLDWWTLPSSPGLRTRIPTAVLLGLSCRAIAPASAAWPLELSWPATWVPEPLCDWSMFWPVRLPLPASAVASALLDWWTLPSSPGLKTRIPTAVLLGSSCAATARAPASCQLLFDWPATWVPDWQPHGVTTGAVTGAAVPPWDWSMFWPVRLMLPASAVASALLDWWTLPSSPGLRTRIPTAVLLGLSCRAIAPASAAWPLELSWPATWVPEPLCDWSMFWPVRLPLPASAVASALLDWWTLPSSPGLRTRIPTAVLLGSSCAATARAPASCQLLFDWPATWVPDWQPHCVATGAATGAAVPPWAW